MLTKIIKKTIKNILTNAGYELIIPGKIPDTITDQSVRDIMTVIQPYTLTEPLNLHNLILAIKHITKNNIPGDIVECGVWKGGSMMAAAKTLQLAGDTTRHLHLFDTFDGMSEPTEEDTTPWGDSASERMKNENKQIAQSVWCYSPIEEVKENLNKTNYPAENIHYIQGKVEDTLTTDNIPDKIAVLRLDTDWYESTKVELEQLWPKLSPGGFLIIDDYGWWNGARKATDEYFADKPDIAFIDIGGPVVAVKPKQ